MYSISFIFVREALTRTLSSLNALNVYLQLCPFQTIRLIKRAFLISGGENVLVILFVFVEQRLRSRYVFGAFSC